MEFSHYLGTMGIGFIFWWLMAPNHKSPHYGQLLLPYVTALLLCMVGTGQLIMVKPAAFFFTVGGFGAMMIVMLKSFVKISIFIEHSNKK